MVISGPLIVVPSLVRLLRDAAAEHDSRYLVSAAVNGEAGKPLRVAASQRREVDERLHPPRDPLIERERILGSELDHWSERELEPISPQGKAALIAADDGDVLRPVSPSLSRVRVQQDRVPLLDSV